MRIVMVLGDSTGGIGTHVGSITRALVDAPTDPGADPDSLAIWAPASTLGRRDLAPLAELGVRLVPMERRWWRQRALLDGADIVHAHGFHAGSRAVTLLRRRARERLVTTWHNLPPLEPARSRIAGRGIAGLVAHGSRLTLGASADLQAVAIALGARDARVCEVSAPALPQPSVGRAEMLAELGIDGPMVLSVSRLAPQKNLGLLLDAWEMLLGDLDRGDLGRANRSAPTLVIAGGGPGEADLRARLERSRLPVRLLGQRDDVANLLGAADLAVSSSDWEARSLVAQEALRSGVPFVGTAVGGVPDLVGDAAVLVSSHDADALADGMRSVLSDPVLAEHLRMAGPERAGHWPDEHRTAAFVRSCYADVLAGPPSPTDSLESVDPVPTEQGAAAVTDDTVGSRDQE